MDRAIAATRLGEDHDFALICVEASIAGARLEAARLRLDIQRQTASLSDARVLTKRLAWLEGLIVSGGVRRHLLLEGLPNAAR